MAFFTFLNFAFLLYVLFLAASRYIWLKRSGGNFDHSVKNDDYMFGSNKQEGVELKDDHSLPRTYFTGNGVSIGGKKEDNKNRNF